MLAVLLPAQSGMISLPGGTFTMGSPAHEPWRKADEGPQRQVSLRPFYISDHEVTFAEYDAFCVATGRSLPQDSSWGRGDRPVINVSWYDAVAYCNWRSEREGLEPAYEMVVSAITGASVRFDPYKPGYRLPTEAEWEYACRAGSADPLTWGNSLSSLEANFDGRYPYGSAASGPYLGKTSAVRSYKPNAFGLYDMHGNVWEWCWDYYGAYAGESAADPLGASWDWRRVCRGGSWVSSGNALRSAKRNCYSPDFSSTSLGFRLARSQDGLKRPEAAAVRPGTVLVRTLPMDKAEVYIDGKRVGDSPDVFSLAEGEHLVEARARYQGKEYAASAKVGIRAGVDEYLSLTLREQIQVPAGMVYVEGGSFYMGSAPGESGRMTDEAPQHTVKLSPFFIGAYEVTFAEYDAFCEATSRPKPSDQGWGRGSRPAINVSWLDAVAYCNWRSQKEGLQPVYTITGADVRMDRSKNGYRLPTEAEWEYACRAGTTTATAFGNRISSEEANFDGGFPYGGAPIGPYLEKTQPVGSYQPNALGIYDMHGNVNEWCWDRYGAYKAEFQTDPEGPDGDSVSRAIRSGGWSDIGRFMRSAYRTGSNPELRNAQTGFRLVRSFR